MSDELRKGMSLVSTSGVGGAIGSAVQGMSYSKEIYQIGEVVRSIVEYSQRLANSREFSAIGRAVESLHGSVVKQLIDQRSGLSRTLRTVVELNSVIGKAVAHHDSELNRKWRSICKLEAICKDKVPNTIFSFVKSNTELYELISSGRITPEQIAAGLDEAISSADGADVTKLLKHRESGADVESEVVKAFLSAGSLKGVSSAGLKYFIAFMLLWQWGVSGLNQNFELQKNIAGLFAPVDTVAEARSLARHVPNGADKSQLSGFRVLTGDGVHLRDGPSQKHQSILQLPMGALLQILDASGKSWILVSVVVDEELHEGWVLRGYTTRIR
jgi:hypothetical protein